MTKKLEKNIHLFSLAYPKEGVHLSYLDMRGLRKEQTTSLFGEKLPSFSKKSQVFFGLGNGDEINRLTFWLGEDKERKAFFFEPDLRVIKKFLSRKNAASALLSEQISIHPVTVESLDFVAWATYKSSFELFCHPYYQLRKAALFKRFSDELHFRILQKETVVEEFMDGSLSFFRNFYKNLDYLPTVKWAPSFYNQFKGIPAILCGAGPSLTQALPLLKSMKDKALIVSGGSATSALVLSGIHPHFAASIDPNSLQVERIKLHEEAKIPHFFRLRLYWEALSRLQGEKIYVPGAGGYDEIAHYFEEGLFEKLPPIEESLDEGYNVINFLLSLLVKLGANPIILVGVDLSFKEGSLYASSLQKSGHLVSSEKKSQNDFGEEVIHRKGVPTLYKWLYEADWIARFVKQEEKCSFLRLGEGLPIPGVTPITEKDLEGRLTRTYPIKEKITRLLAKKGRKPLFSKLETLKEELFASLTRCKGLLEQLLHLGEEALNQKMPMPTSALLLEEKLTQEIGFSLLLEGFNQIAQALQGPRLRHLKMKQVTSTKERIDLEKIILQNERVQFLLTTVRNNLSIFLWAKTIQ